MDSEHTIKMLANAAVLMATKGAEWYAKVHGQPMPTLERIKDEVKGAWSLAMHDVRAAFDAHMFDAGVATFQASMLQAGINAFRSYAVAGCEF